MKFNYPTTVVADTTITFTYTAEPGDPSQFFFEILVGGGHIAVGNIPSSGSGTFTSRPGDLGAHVIQAFAIGADPTKDQPFATGPTYNVFAPGSIPTTQRETPTQPVISSALPAFDPSAFKSPFVPPAPTPPNQLEGASSEPLTATITVPNHATTILQSTESNDGNTRTLEAPVPTSAPTSAASTSIEVSRDVISTSISQSGSVMVTLEVVYSAGPGTSTLFTEEIQTSEIFPSPSGNTSLAGAPSQGHGTHNNGAIIGGIVAAVVLCALVVLGLLVYRARRRARLNEPELDSPLPSPIQDAVRDEPASEPAPGRRFLPLTAYFARVDEKSTPAVSLPAEGYQSTEKLKSAEWDEDAEPSSGYDYGVGIPAGEKMEWVRRPTDDPPPGYISPGDCLICLSIVLPDHCCM
ncbi:hypothetical protein FB45DRAFT_482032 [Roridomyces roridus]|uniref:Uncharacterized protein n=1 Tax=Roridomyces roridus TaxID=1738132 RepID=A0AAD7C040_9AGAR|nr:hypothetical protein FB45DRAFT_482032 [Roridomyces roridus]